MKTIQFDYKNSLVKNSEIKKSLKSLRGQINVLKKATKDSSCSDWSCFIRLPFDKNIIAESKRIFLKKGGHKIKHVFVIGIGGSSNGIRGIYDAILSVKELKAKLVFLDTFSGSTPRDIKNLLGKEIKNKNDFVVAIISKSGTTTETIANFEILNEILVKKFGNISDRIVAITDRGSKLWNAAILKKVSILEIPKKAGGRFSTFSPVGVFPLLCAGVDADSIFRGARDITNKCLSEKISENISAISASILFNYYKKGISIYNMFFFGQEFESLGKWHRMIVAESLGKENDENGKKINSGITPIVSIGTSDLHALAPLYFDGPKNKFTSFIRVEKSKENKPPRLLNKCGGKIPKNLFLGNLISGINGKSSSYLMRTVSDGVMEVYKKSKLPYVSVEFPEISEYYIGQFMQSKMIEVVYLAKLLNVNPFNQPAVEKYKEEVRNNLCPFGTSPAGRQLNTNH